MEMDEKMVKNSIQVNEERQMFQLFFLKDDQDQSVEVVEGEEIDFEMVTHHIKRGESVFITPKRKEKLETSLFEEEGVADPWYFTHI